MNKFFPVSALALACAPSLPALAESKLEEIVVTSSRVEMPLRQVGTSISVITREDIKLSGFNSLYEILRSQPAISANNTGGAGGITSLQIRGEDGYRTLVLIDDIDISDTSGPQVSPRVEHLLSSGIQRVEILRGPQGLMYGADAGGVINIQTLAAEEGLHGSASAETGRYGTRQLTADLGGGNGTIDYAVMASDYETDGFNARDTDTVLRDDDGYENTTLHGRVGWNVSEDLRLQLVARDVDTEGEYDSCSTVDSFAPSDDCSNEFEQQAWRASADYTLGRFSHQLAYSGSDTERQSYTEGSPSFGSEGDLERRTYLGSFRGGDALRLVYGVDLLTESLDDGTFDRERDQDGYYLEYQGELTENLFITAGARYDDNEDYGSHTTWRTSAAYILSLTGGELKFRGAYGTGFRAPSLYEISYNGGFFAYPPASDTELKEEESEGLDVGLAWYGESGLQLEANYFDQKIDDVIYFDLQNFSGYLQDKGEASSSGVELIAEVPLLETLALNGNYTYNDSEDVDGSTRPRRPEHLANLALRWSPLDGKLVLAMHVRATRGARDTDGSSMDDYEVVDLTASWEFLQGLELYGRVENLFDEDYQEVPTYNTSGAAAYAGLRFSF
jgi:vitamin B12 transporter